MRSKIALVGARQILDLQDERWVDPSVPHLANDAGERDALMTLVAQLDSLHKWLDCTQLADHDFIAPYVEAMEQVLAQDTEQDEHGRVRIIRGVAEDRRVSIEDAQMRHGRKSKSKRCNGYEQHIAMDLDTALIMACVVTPANRPEEEATPQRQAHLYNQRAKFDRLYIDRGYINSTLVDEAQASGAEVICKPWLIRGGKPNLFKKTDFKLDMRSRTITCPAVQVESFEPGHTVEFDPEVRLVHASRAMHALGKRQRTHSQHRE